MMFPLLNIQAIRATDIALPGTPYSINCVDFDIDGDIDIVVGCNSYEGDTIAIFLNDGYGNFESVFHPRTNNLFYTQCADMNGDNLPDIVAINDDLEYGYYTNIGNGLIGEWHYIFDFTGEMVTEVCDFDNNGFNDLLYFQNLNPGKWGIVYNYGDNSFTNEIHYSYSENLTSVCSGYLDEDTLRDVLIVSPDPSLGSKVFYRSDSSFAQSENTFPRSMAGFIVDLNNDNNCDIALANGGTYSSVTLFKNLGNDNFENIDTIYLPEDSSIKGFPDLNNDSFPDIFHRTSLPSIGFDEIYVSYNNFNWNFLSPHNYIIGEPSMPITQDYCDLNGDGYVDLLMANYLPGRLMKLLWNDGTGYFVSNNPLHIKNHNELLLEDTRVYPNPFSSSTSIELSLHKTSYIQVKIYDNNGRIMKNLLSTELKHGTYMFSWEGDNNHGCKINKGVYFICVYCNSRLIKTIKSVYF